MGIRLLITALVMAITIVALMSTLKLCRKRPTVIVLCGMPGCGKTKLYQFMLNGRVPETVKSARVTTFTGTIDAIPEREITLVDLPSDERACERFDFTTATHVVFMQHDGSHQAALRLARLIGRLRRHVTIYVTADPDGTFLTAVRTEYAQLEGIEDVDIAVEQQMVQLSAGPDDIVALSSELTSLLAR